MEHGGQWGQGGKGGQGEQGDRGDRGTGGIGGREPGRTGSGRGIYLRAESGSRN